MATPTVVLTNLTEWDDGDSTGNWTSDGSGIASHSGFQREGTACIGDQASNGATHIWATGTSTDLTGERVYVWIQLHGAADTKANGGFRIVLGDGTNRIAYHVGGSDDFGFQLGAWSCFVLDIDNRSGMSFTTLAGSEASLATTAITEIGGGASNTAKALGNVDNVFIDIVRYGTGLIVYGGTSSDPITLSELAADDADTAAGKAYGIIREIQTGIFGIQGDIIFGDSGGTNEIWWEDTNVVAVIEDHIHGTGTPTGLDISIVGNATATNQHVEWGIAVGSGDDESGRDGVSWINANTSLPVTFNASDVDFDDFLMFGGGFNGFVATAAGQDLIFSNDATLGPTHRISGATFSKCGQIDLGRVVTRNCIFSGHTGTDAALLWNENIDIKNSQFLANTDATNDPAGVEHPSDTGSPYTYDNLTFSANDFDINNTSGAAITVDAINGSNPSTSKGSSVTINNSVLLSVTCVDDAQNPVENAAVWILSGSTVLMNEFTDATGLAEETYNYVGDSDITVRIRKNSPSGTRYEPIDTVGEITIDGFSLTAVLQEDSIAD